MRKEAPVPAVRPHPALRQVRCRRGLSVATPGAGKSVAAPTTGCQRKVGARAASRQRPETRSGQRPAPNETARLFPEARQAPARPPPARTGCGPPRPTRIPSGGWSAVRAEHSTTKGRSGEAPRSPRHRRRNASVVYRTWAVIRRLPYRASQADFPNRHYPIRVSLAESNGGKNTSASSSQECACPASTVIIGVPGEEPAPFDDAVTASHPVLTADIRPALIDDAAHGVAVDGRAPAISEAAHHRSAPAILRREARRDLLFAGQQDLQTAATGLAVRA